MTCSDGQLSCSACFLSKPPCLNGQRYIIILGFLVIFLYVKCQQNHSNKLLSGAGSPSCRPGSAQLTCRKIKNGKLNMTLRQGDEEVKKKE